MTASPNRRVIIGWSPEDEALLRARYPSEGADVLAREMGRTKGSVESKAKKLGLTLTDEKRRDSYLRPRPADFAEMFARLGERECIKHYQTGKTTMARWMDEIGRDRLRRQRKGHTANTFRAAQAVRNRQARTPARSKASGLWSGRSDAVGMADPASLAARHLQSHYSPVYSAEKVLGKQHAGIYVVGTRKLPVSEMMALAQSKGWAHA